jgi:hypothetical protein
MAESALTGAFVYEPSLFLNNAVTHAKLNILFQIVPCKKKLGTKKSRNGIFMVYDISFLGPASEIRH